MQHRKSWVDAAALYPAPLVSRRAFLTDIQDALDRQIPFAAGKLGMSEKVWLYYPLLLSRHPAKIRQRAFERMLAFHALDNSGIFPADPNFYATFVEFYVATLRQLDYVGLFLEPAAMEAELIRFHGLRNQLTYFQDQEPDRSSPSNAANCYLPYFAGKRILLVCPFANLLRQRATQVIFQGVWSKTGKKWFYPAHVDALEFPYGFAATTQARYTTALALLDHITGEIARREFDVALIAAGGLAIPLAAFVKRMGKIGVSLGGHLQVLFGVLGKRWREMPGWRETYVNEWWIDMPDVYKPVEPNVGDLGSYW